jgi:hypothetical protein
MFKESALFDRYLGMCVNRVKKALTEIKESENCFATRLQTLTTLKQDYLERIRCLLVLNDTVAELPKLLPSNLFYEILWFPNFSVTILSSPRSLSGDVQPQLLQAVEFLELFYGSSDEVYAGCIRAFVEETVGICKGVQQRVEDSIVYRPRMLIKNSLMQIIGLLYEKIRSVSLRHDCFELIQQLTSAPTRFITSFDAEITAIYVDGSLIFKDRHKTYCQLTLSLEGPL